MADKNMKICIIGGGPAGLSAGMYLEQKGYAESAGPRITTASVMRWALSWVFLHTTLYMM